MEVEEDELKVEEEEEVEQQEVEDDLVNEVVAEEEIGGIGGGGGGVYFCRFNGKNADRSESTENPGTNRSRERKVRKHEDIHHVC